MINDNINGLVQQLDDLLVKREKQYAIVEKAYALDGDDKHIRSSDYSEYKRRKDRVTEDFNRDFMEAQNKLSDLCNHIRKRQPRFSDLRITDINNSGRVPRNIVFGRTRVTYKNLDILLPHTIPFPVNRPVVLPSDRDTEALFSLILRLLYTLPLGKLELNAYDPNHFGASLQRYNRLFTNKQLSPFGKICNDKEELTGMLKKITQYCENLIQNVFDNSSCSNWREYNDKMYATGQPRAVLPYKVLFLCDVPDNINPDNADLLMRLSNVCERCGVLIAMTVNEAHFNSQEHTYWDNNIKRMYNYVKGCSAMETLLSSVDNMASVRYLDLAPQYEPLPDAVRFNELVDAYLAALDEQDEQGGEFSNLFDAKEFFSCSSVDGVNAALGYLEDGSESILPVCNEFPHVLIGGSTGSGKSNLLHVMITNLCRRYSPDELALYMLDFKEGVELNAYAYPVLLPHAHLIATEADVEFGVSTLEHIDREVKSRYSVFKKAGCKQYSDYRKKHPGEKLPRIIVIIDEFQVMFHEENCVKVSFLMESIVKQGRAAGVHLVMATQTLSGLTEKGVPFNSIAPQFVSRIALKCSAVESAAILGASAGANNAAALIKIPFAIMNCCSGIVSENVKFSVPNADGCVSEAVERISREWTQRGGIAESKLFNGDMMPLIPDKDAYISDSTQLLLGETADYSCNKLRLRLENDITSSNVLFCGNDKIIADSFKHSVMLSADGSCGIDGVIIIGGGDFLPISKNVVYYSNLSEFVTAGKQEAEVLGKKLIIMNGCNPVKELGYSNSQYIVMNEDAKWFKEFMSSCAENGTHIVLFFNTAEQFKAAWLSSEMFGYVVAFMLVKNSLLNLFTVPMSTKNDFMPAKRAFLFKNGIEIGRFKPYVNTNGEDDE